VKSNQKPTVPKPLDRRAGSPHQFKPVVAQLKTPVSAQNMKRPVAPPVYCPQPTPKVLQTKSSSPPISHARQAPRPTIAPAVHRPAAKKIVQAKTISNVQPKPVSRVIQRTPEEGENLRKLGLIWHGIAEQDKESKDKAKFFGHVREIQKKLGFRVYTVWHKHDPYVAGGKNKSYKKIVDALKGSADAGKTYADLYIAWATSPLSIAALPHELQELVIIVHIAEVGRGYLHAPEMLFSFMEKVSKEPDKAKRTLLWNSFKDQNVYAYTAKEDDEFKPDPMEMGDEVPGYEPPETRARKKSKVAAAS